MRDELPGTVKLIFQPAEEGPPAGEKGGASLMIEEGAFEDPAPEAVFGLHVMTGKVGTINYKPRGAMAAADGLRIVVRGSQTHGAMPWAGVDPIVVSSQIVLGLQTIVSRQSDIRVAPAIVTVGSIQGGVRGNIIPDSVVMTGTIRTYDADMQTEIHERIRSTAQHIAASAGAEAQVDISLGVPVTWNDPDLTEEMLPTLRRVAGAENVIEGLPTTGAEDFSLFAQQAPGLFLFLGGRPADVPPEAAPPNHSPYFFVDEAALPLGVKAISSLAVDYMWMNAGGR
jgi:amidohydrolase